MKNLKKYIFILLAVTVFIVNTNCISANTIKSTIEPQIDVSFNHTVCLDSNGNVWTWGENSEGQLGTGNAINKNKPVKVLTNAKCILAAEDNNSSYTLAIKNDGTLWGWGSNNYGQIGNNDPLLPAKITDNVKSIYSSDGSTFIIKNDNSLWAIGKNSYGALGDNTTEHRRSPVKIMDNIRYVHTYSGTTMAITIDNVLWGWGRNYESQVLPGKGNIVKSPIKIMENVKTVKSQSVSTMAVKTDNTLWTWGYGGNIPAKKLSNVKDIKGSNSILKIDDTLWKQVSYSFEKIADNVKDANDYSILKNNNTLYEIEYGMYEDEIIKVLDNVKSVDASISHIVAIKEDNTLWAKGSNFSGQLGDGSYDDRDSFVKINLQMPETESNPQPTPKPENPEFDKDTEERYKIREFEFEIKSQNGISVSAIPGMEGAEFKLKIPKLGTQVLIKDDKTFQAIVGIGLPKVDENFNLVASKSEVEEFKEIFKEFEKACNYEGNDLFKFKKIGNENKPKIPLFDKFKVHNIQLNAYGILEGTIEENGKPNFTKNIVKISAKNDKIFDTETRFIFMGVPLVGKLNAGAGMNLAGTVNLDSKDIYDKFASEGEIDVSFKASGGVGIPYAFEVTPYGKANLTYKNDNPGFYQSLIATGETGVDYELLFIFGGNAKFNFPKEGKKLVFFDSYPKSIYNISENYSLQKKYKASEIKLIERDYLKKKSTWMGSTPRQVITSNSNKINTTIATNIFPNSEPKIQEVNGKKIIVFQRDNEDRGSADRTELVYSIYNEQTKTWSNPIPVYDDGTGDFYYDLASDGKDLFVTWQNANIKFDNKIPSVEEICEVSEIMVSKFNTITNRFEKPTRMTNDSELDTNPKISVKNGTAMLTWMANNGNDILAKKGDTFILTSFYDGSQWSGSKGDEGSEMSFVDNAQDIISYSTAYDGSTGYIVYEKDKDGNLETNDDHYISFVETDLNSFSDEIAITPKEKFYSSPKIFINGDKVSVFTYSNNNIEYIEDIYNPNPKIIFNKEVDGLNDRFKVINNNGKIAILWIKDVNEIKEVYASIYDLETNRMSEEIKITNLNQRIKNVDGIFDSNGKINLIYNKANKVKEVVEDTQYYVDGQNDLGYTEIILSHNLSINKESIEVYDDEFKVGSPIKISVDIENKGELKVSDYKIDIYDEEIVNSKDTSLITINKSDIIYPGESKKVDINFTPIELKSYNLSLKLTPIGCNDFDESDNTTDIKVGQEDIIMSHLSSYNNNGNIDISFIAKNNSNINSNKKTIYIKEASKEGKNISSHSITPLKANETKTFNITIDSKNISSKDEEIAIYVVLGDSYDFTLVSIPKNEIQFKDIKGHWAEKNIVDFVSKGYVSGYNDGTFRPNNNITRAEFVKILNKVFGLTKSSGKVFSDTKTHWAKYDIDIAVTNGVCNGKSATEFKPNDAITREEAAVMISNYKKISDNNFDKINKYKDSSKVALWAKPGVEGIIEKGYMSGYSDNTFRPKNKITRAEAVATLSRIK